MTEFSSHASLDLRGRLPKAEKIWYLLAPRIKGRNRVRLLEVGAGSGAISSHFASIEDARFAVAAVDVEDQREARDGYEFMVYNGTRLPFPDETFDVVISNHVIEHVGNRARQAEHVREIARVLANDGVVYVATPSRWQFIEPHFRLAALSWLPRRWRDGYVRLSGRGSRYDCDPFGHHEFELMLERSGLRYRNINAAALRATLVLEPGRHRVAALIAYIPEALLNLGYRFSPTMVYLAGKSDAFAQSS